MCHLRIADGHRRTNRHMGAIDCEPGLDFRDLPKSFNGFIPKWPVIS